MQSVAFTKMQAVINRLWRPLYGNTTELRLDAGRGERYLAARDFAHVLRVCLPVAAEYAAAARPEWAEDTESPLALVAGKYALALCSRETCLDVLADGFAPLLESDEECEAFALLGSSLALALLLYILTVPNLAMSVGELHPGLHEDALAGMCRAASWDTSGPWWRTWWRKRARRRELNRLLAAGTLPDHPWVRRFLQQTASGTIWRVLDKLIEDGLMTDAGPDAAGGPDAAE